MSHDLGDLSEAAERVMGEDAWVLEPAARPGNWLFIGGVLAVALMALAHLSWWVVALIMLAAGTVANDREKRQIRRRIAERERMA